jgi:HSP20 family protein
MLETMFARPQGIFDQLESLHRILSRSMGIDGGPGTIRSVAHGAFPEINVGRTPKSVEIFVFAPGLDASSIDVTVERNVLKISGSRSSTIPRGDAPVQLYANERPEGKFTRGVSLPDDADTSRVDATYRNGILRVSIAVTEAAKPKRITVQ